jgi:hypothetical protein
MNQTPRPFHTLFKALILFVTVNLAYGLIQPPVGELSAYNRLFPGLKRMSFGSYGNPFAVELHNADAMFASHEISAGRQDDEIRVALIGDSTVWGDGLDIPDTLSEQWNALAPHCNGKRVQIYNLGYPHPSILKDLVFIEEAKERRPDVIVWMITLNTVMNQYRVNPFLTENRVRILELIDAYDIPYGARKILSETPTGFYEQTLMGQRSFLARWIKLQALGLIWTATGRDFPITHVQAEPAAADVKKDPSYRDLEPGTDLRTWLLLRALSVGFDLTGEIPLLLVNEPIYIARGMNSDIRYNDLYPRWAFDQYREIIAAQARASSLPYLDLWDAIPPENFTDSLHLSAEGERLLAERLHSAVLSTVCK